MTMQLSRRTLLATLSAALATPLRAQAPAIHVVKDPDCSCCGAWIEHLRAENFPTTVEERALDDLIRYKTEMGIPEALASCHTATVDGYVLEGHVPAADIRRLLNERPEAVGLAVPGMPYGSPGMGPDAERDAYDVMLVLRDGSSTVFTRYPAA